jgi:hypothetical protein
VTRDDLSFLLGYLVLASIAVAVLLLVCGCKPQHHSNIPRPNSVAERSEH